MMELGKENNFEAESKLLESTAYVHAGQHRIATPDKHAIMTLSRSYVKHHLRKQQQLLHDITHKCREQEVAELSSNITKKVKLTDSVIKDGINMMSPRVKVKQDNPAVSVVANAKVPESDTCQCLGGGASIPSTESEAGSSAGGNAMFPQRKVLRSPRKDGPASSSLPRLSISYRKGVPSSDHYYHRAVVLNQHQINGQIQLHHYIQPRMDQLAPLVLPNIRQRGLDNNNISTYMQAKRLNISVAPKPGTNKAAIRITARTLTQ